jgi:prolyl 4-hydroxylase
MSSKFKSYIIYIIIAIIIFIIIYYLWKCMSNKKIIQIDQFKQTLEYADNNEPYDKPFILQNFITTDECNSIINRSKDKLFDSEVVGGKIKNIRNSQQYWINKNDPLVENMFKKVSGMFNIPIENAEDLQVVRYLPGQYYNEHHDACCDDNDKCEDFVKTGGQRMLTVLIYLNNDFEDGNTYFKNMNIKLKPPAGDAIVFYPLARGTNKCHPLALHAGMPVTSGEKWVANLWFREKKFR